MKSAAALIIIAILALPLYGDDPEEVAGSTLPVQAVKPAADEAPVLLGRGRVTLLKEHGQWQLLVDRQTYIVKGMEYSPDPVGRVANESNMWMNDDFNNNGKCDGPYDSWIDKNNNNYQDLDEET